MNTQILIHAHVYYVDMWSQIRAFLDQEALCHAELWVTYVGNQEQLKKEVLQFAPTAHVLQVPNKGYDIAPFVEVCKQARLENFDYCIKIHTKQDMEPRMFLSSDPSLGWIDLTGSKWRDKLLLFLQTQNLTACLKAFKNNKRLGMVAFKELIFTNEPADKNAWNWGIELLQEAGLKLKSPAFVAGSMFMCRAALLQPAINLLSEKQFEQPSREIACSISHAAERFLGFCISAQGYSIEDVFTTTEELRKLSIHKKLKPLLRFFYQHKKNNNGRNIIKICKIPVFVGKSHSDSHTNS